MRVRDRRLIFGLVGLCGIIACFALIQWSGDQSAIESATELSGPTSFTAELRDSTALIGSSTTQIMAPQDPSTKEASNDTEKLGSSGSAKVVADQLAETTLPPLTAELKKSMLSCVAGTKAYASVRATEFSSFDEFLDLGLVKGGERVRDQVSTKSGHSSGQMNDQSARQKSRDNAPLGIEVHTQVVNVHIRNDRSGEVFRLHVTPRSLDPDAEGSRRFEIKYFGVDRENLPIPMPVPDDLLPNRQDFRWQESVETFKRRGNVIYDEVVETWSWNDPEPKSARVTKDFGKIREFQMFFAGRSLGCSGTSKNPPNCRCF
jgi:hypothetical protein